MNRREFVVASSAAAAGLLTGCRSSTDVDDSSDAAHLTARPGTPTSSPTLGKTPLGLGTNRDGFLYVPPSYSATQPASLLVLLHGAGRSAADWESAPFDTLFGSRNIVVLAPESRDVSWDIRFGGFGPDVEFIDDALALVFSRCAINPSSIALGGFSDGASYALSLGVSNGDLFTALMGFSPGFYFPDKLRGKPKIFLSHGTTDTVLPFGFTKFDLAPSLRSAGYDVTYVEFNGGHQLPLAVATQAMDWFKA